MQRQKWNLLLTRCCYAGFDKEFFRENQEVLNTRNLHTLVSANLLAMGMFLLLTLLSLVLPYLSHLTVIYGLCFLFSCLLALFNGLVLKGNPGLVRWGVVLFLCLCYAFGLALGIASRPNVSSTMFLVLLLALPALFIQKPGFSAVFQTVVFACYVLMTLLSKTPDIVTSDLFNGAGCLILSLYLMYFSTNIQLKNIQSQNELSTLCTLDELTGLYNRRTFNRSIEGLFSTARKKGAEFSLIIFDIDDFKSCNDTYGHLAGDSCLIELGKLFRLFASHHNLFLARYGGEEFIAVDTGNTAEQTFRNVQQFLGQVARQRFILGKEISSSITLSAGVASQSMVQAASYIELIDAADTALYLAKSRGKNQVALAPGPEA